MGQFGLTPREIEIVQMIAPLRDAGLIECVNVDTIGIGYYLARHLEDLKFPVNDINVGEAANDSERFLNLKAEAYWGLSLRAKAVRVPVNIDLASRATHSPTSSR